MLLPANYNTQGTALKRHLQQLHECHFATGWQPLPKHALAARFVAIMYAPHLGQHASGGTGRAQPQAKWGTGR